MEVSIVDIDVRTNETSKIEKIIFADNKYITKWAECILINDSNRYHEILIKDIPNLIKALEIAYKEWR